MYLSHLEQLGLTDRSLVQLRELPHVLRAEARELGDALDSLRELAEIAGLQFEGSSRDVRHVRDAVSIAKEAPTDLLPYRRRAFETPTVAAELAQAKKQASDLRQLRLTLAQALYLDQELDSRVLEQAIRALREGDGILRWLNGAWRKARKLHRSMSISKEKKLAKERAEDLSGFARLLAEEKAFTESPDCAAAFGQLFRGPATEWVDIERLATWYYTSQQILLETDLPAPTLDLTTIPTTRLSQLKTRAHQLDIKLETLDRIRARIVRSLSERPLIDPTTRRQRSWKDVVSVLEGIAGTVEEAVHALGHLAYLECTPQQVSEAVHACLQHPTAVEKVRAFELAKQLLGAYFAELDTDLPLVGLAYSWGRSVAESTVPDEVEGLAASEYRPAWNLCRHTLARNANCSSLGDDPVLCERG